MSAFLRDHQQNGQLARAGMRLAALGDRLAVSLRMTVARVARHRRLLVGLSGVQLILAAAGAMPVASAILSIGMAILLAAAIGPPDKPWWHAGLGGIDGSAVAGNGAAADEEIWRALVDALHDPALVLDAEGEVLHHNPALADLFPRARAGAPLINVTRSPELIEAVEAARQSPDRIVVELKDRVPVSRNITATISRLVQPTKSGESLADPGPALFIVFRDMTDQEKLAQMRADFIANASHELRTPLASLRGFVETLQGAARDDKASRERFLAIMATQASRMTRLIDDLLALSRAEMRVHLLPRGVVDLRDMLTFVVQALEPMAQSNRIAISLAVPEGPLSVRGERDELVQVFQNLVQNALKYGRENGHVDIRVARELAGAGHGQRLVVSVSDDGPGIAEAHLPRLTERFYRVNVAQSREKGGTGLGLAIVKYIVNRHRGELRITSELGKGSTFTVLLEEARSR